MISQCLSIKTHKGIYDIINHRNYKNTHTNIRNSAQLHTSCPCRNLLTKRYETTSLLISKCTALGIAEFVQVGLTRKLNHRWWPTHENERLTAGGREVGFNHICSDEARTVLPIWNKENKLLILISLQPKAFLNCIRWNCEVAEESATFATITASKERIKSITELKFNGRLW